MGDLSASPMLDHIIDSTKSQSDALYVLRLILRTWRFDTCTFLPCWGSTRLSVQDIPAEHPHSWNG